MPHRNPFPSFTFSSDISFTKPPPHRYPLDIYKWIKTNAKPRLSLKLMQICKYFCYKKFPYFVTHSIEWFEENEFTCQKICKDDFLKMEKPYPDIWITGSLVFRQFPNICKILMPHVIACDVILIHLERQTVLFEDFKILAASGTIEILHCYGDTKICDSSDQIPSLEDLLECLPKLTRLTFSGNVPSLTVSDMMKVKYLPNLRCLSFSITDEIFDFNNFVNFMKLNLYPKTDFKVKYIVPLLPNFIHKLEGFVYDLLKVGLTNHYPPLIEYTEQEKSSAEELEDLREAFKNANPESG